MRKSKVDVSIKQPSRKVILKACADWKKGKFGGKYPRQEKLLKKLFSKLPNNKKLRNVLLKVSKLNCYYSTRIHDIYPVVQHIVNITTFDERIRKSKPDAKLVKNLYWNRTSSGKKRLYSFATKYCSFHNPNVYPIFDRCVVDALSAINKKFNFADFTKTGLHKDKDYEEYCKIYKKFISRFKLKGLTYKQIDHYLWHLGKRLRAK